MTEQTATKSWLDKLSDVLMREPQDRKQLLMLLRDAEQRDLIAPDALAMIEGVLQVSEMQVRDVMIPRAQMVVVEEQQQLSEFLPLIVETAHSRFPVVNEAHDEVIGILHAKDLLRFVAQDSDAFNLRDVVRPAAHVPESKPLNILLKEFRNSHNHMAVVVDEYGGVAGVVTIEDVLEQIVGDIVDEFDVDEDAFIKKHSDDKYIIKALTPLDEFEEYFQTKLDKHDCDTVGGLLMQHFGHMPERGEAVDIGAFHFRVINADKRRIHLLQMHLLDR